MVATITPVIQTGFAAAGSKNTIPVASSPTPGLASFNDGFPPLTRTPISSGGIPPSGLDMNGILFDATDPLAQMSKGGWFTYNSAYATAIGGYAVGARLLRSDGLGFWLNLTAGNATDPEGGSPSGWVGVNPYGNITIAASNAPIVLTNIQAAHGIIIISGTLTANVLVTFPAWQGTWLVFNGTSGAFALTVKAAGGSAVTALPSGLTGTLVYCNGGECGDALASYARGAALANYLTTTAAASTYETQSAAAATYLTIASPTYTGTCSGPVADFSTSMATSQIFAHSGSTTIVATDFQISSVGPYKIYPAVNNSCAVGTITNAFQAMYSFAFNVASDARLKTKLIVLSKAELAAAKELAEGIGTYELLMDEGKGKRHVGVIAQAVVAVLTKHKLDWEKYAFVEHQAWGAHELGTPHDNGDDEHVIKVKAGDRYMINYHQLAMFLLTAQDQRIAALEAKPA